MVHIYRFRKALIFQEKNFVMVIMINKKHIIYITSPGLLLTQCNYEMWFFPPHDFHIGSSDSYVLWVKLVKHVIFQSNFYY
jgi:hypothetical protein